MRGSWLLVAVAGCGRIAFDPLASDGGADAPTCTAWSTPTRIDSVRSSRNDWEPAVRPGDGLLVFASTRATGTSQELYVATRTGPASFSDPALITAISTVGARYEGGPAWSPDGSQLYFHSPRAGGGDHLFVSMYAQGQFSAPVEVAELASGRVHAPTISRDGLELYYDDAVFQAPRSDVYRATRESTTSPWVTAGVQSQLWVGGQTGWPALAPDGLTIYFESNASGTAVLYEAHRPSTDDLFGSPTMIPAFDGSLYDYGDPEITTTGDTLFFSARSSTPPSDADIYLVTRTCT